MQNAPLPSLTLHQATTDDEIARVRAIAEATWPHCYKGIIPESQITYMIGWMYNAETIREQTAKGTPFFLVNADGSDCGLVSFDTVPSPADGSCELHKIYTLPECWGRGIGHWILEEVCRRVREAGASSVWLRVNKNNLRAQKAYRAAGFENVESVCTDIGSGFVMDDYVYRRTF